MSFTQKPTAVLTFGGRRYFLRLSYNNVLRYYRFLSSETALPERMRLELAYGILVKRPRAAKSEEIAPVLKKIGEEFLTLTNRRMGERGERTVDFEQDSPYIYAAFLQVYGIDLFRERGKLSWQKFLALFYSLPEGCKIGEIMAIRGRKLPSPNRYNAAEIAWLTRAKRFYALERGESEQRERSRDAKAMLFEALLVRANQKE
ncbi:MAG: bacteriophage Gp15 family protein [Bacteroides sp.]|nr:bacteriophage Gp15 family protein [Bacteroides sp.]